MIRRLAVSIACLASSVVPAAAQGNGHGHAYGLLKSSGGTPSSGGAAQVQPAAVAGVRNFGSWLDDATIMAPGSGSLTLSFGWFRSPLFHEFDAPVADGGIGVHKTVQFGFSVPYYHVNEPGGPVVRGLGDLYLSSKVQLRAPDSKRGGVGFAVIPIVEVLSGDPTGTGRRFNWAAPLAVEFDGASWRTFGTIGYFSQGSAFASGAVEVSASERLTFTGTLTQSHSTIDDEPAASLILSRTRTDVSGGATCMLRSGLALFGSVGRTISRQDANAARIAVSGGLSFNFDAWRMGKTK